jgi:hypothetical protein
MAPSAMSAAAATAIGRAWRDAMERDIGKSLLECVGDGAGA